MLLPVTVFDANGAPQFEDAAIASFHSGFAFTASGKIAISAIDGALPAGAAIRNGFAFTSDGKLLVAVDKSVVGAVNNGGALFQPQGALHVTGNTGGVSRNGFLMDASGRLQGGGLIVAAVWDATAVGGNIALSENDRTATQVNGNLSTIVRATVPKATGKFYWEVLVLSMTGPGRTGGIGICVSNEPLNTFLGTSAGAYAWVGPGDGTFEAAVMNNNVQTNATTFRYVQGDLLGFALDIAASKLWLRKNGAAWIGGGDPVAGTVPSWAVPAAGTYVIGGSPFKVANAYRLNTHPSQLVGVAPFGFQAGWY